jgi:hypothetical protein
MNLSNLFRPTFLKLCLLSFGATLVIGSPALLAQTTNQQMNQPVPTTPDYVQGESNPNTFNPTRTSPSSQNIDNTAPIDRPRSNTSTPDYVQGESNTNNNNSNTTSNQNTNQPVQGLW